MYLAKMLPLPAFPEYDAFNDDIPSRIIYEQTQDIGEEDNPNLYYYVVKWFLRAVHNYHQVFAVTVDLPEQMFQARSTQEANQYRNEMMRNLFPGISNRKAAQMPTTPDRSAEDSIKTYLDAHNIFPRLGTDSAPAPAAYNIDKYVMYDMDL